MKVPEQYKSGFTSCMGSVFLKDTKVGDVPVIDIRGWGYLTGGGALNMKEEEAAKVQDDFEKWVVQTLNNAIKNDN